MSTCHQSELSGVGGIDDAITPDTPDDLPVPQNLHGGAITASIFNTRLLPIESWPTVEGVGACVRNADSGIDTLEALVALPV